VKIAILGTRGSWHAERLHEAGVKLGYDIYQIDFRRLRASLSSADASLELESFDLMNVDGVLVRGIPAGSLEQVVFRMDALHRLEAAGITVMNSARAVESCVDKYLTTARLQAWGLPVPRTITCESLDDAMEAYHRLGGDVVVKPLFGSEGRGIVRASSEAMAYRVFWTLSRLQSILYIQEYIYHPGHDYRLFVIGGQVKAAMKRHATLDFRTNVAQGGIAEAYRPTVEWEELAARATQAVGAEIAGVDLLTGPDGQPLVIEVNSTPGFKALSQTTDVTLAEAILRHLAQKIEKG
jgi:ribosomal protein S6--L-glutamate ligase